MSGGGRGSETPVSGTRVDRSVSAQNWQYLPRDARSEFFRHRQRTRLNGKHNSTQAQTGCCYAGTLTHYLKSIRKVASYEHLDAETETSQHLQPIEVMFQNYRLHQVVQEVVLSCGGIGLNSGVA